MKLVKFRKTPHFNQNSSTVMGISTNRLVLTRLKNTQRYCNSKAQYSSKVSLLMHGIGKQLMLHCIPDSQFLIWGDGS